MARRNLPILTTPSPGTFLGLCPLGQKHVAPEIQRFTPGENLERESKFVQFYAVFTQSCIWSGCVVGGCKGIKVLSHSTAWLPSLTPCLESFACAALIFNLFRVESFIPWIQDTIRDWPNLHLNNNNDNKNYVVILYEPEIKMTMNLSEIVQERCVKLISK